MLIDLTILARGGGGGSSGGGGSGGGGAGSGLLLIGYVPMHVMAANAKKHTNEVLASLVVWPLAIGYCVLLVLFLKGIGVVAGVGAILGAGAGLYGWFDKVLKLNKKAEKALAVAAAADSSWDEAKLTELSRQTFDRYQKDWTNNDTSQLATYMTPHYASHALLMITALKQAGRQDKVLQPTITDLKIIQVGDVPGADHDSFMVYINAQADDQLIDLKTEKVLFRDTTAFAEYWSFERLNGKWMLSGIQQATANGYQYNPSLEAFAAQHQYFYSLDWGWLLLPQRGQLFGGANFGRSDINNHVIGVYKDVLVQIYNYIPVKSDDQKRNYLIAQSTLPKSYGNIVVRRRRRFRIRGMRGLTKVSLEWQDFNKKFEVWASDLERVTSFELLNPSYMVKLEALPFEVNIEVVDNVVYLYSAKVPANSPNYQILLDILNEAFKEMKM